MSLAPHDGLHYRRVWFRAFDSTWEVWRAGDFIGWAVRKGRHWQAGTVPDGRFLVDEDGCPRWYRTRADAVLPLAMIAEGMEP